MRLRERKKVMLRDTIMRNAIGMFLDRGYDAVNVAEIASVSLCSRSTFHRYFGTKEDLLFPGVDDRLLTLRATLACADPTEDPWAVAREASVEGLCGFLDDLPPELRSAFIWLWFNEQSPRRRYLEIVLEWETALSGYLARHLGVDAERSLECQLVTMSISSGLRAALNTAMHTGDDVEMLVSRAFELIEAGLWADVTSTDTNEAR